MEDTFNEATLQQSKQIDESSLKELTGTFKEKWLTLLKTIKKNYNIIKDQLQTLDSNLKNFKSHLDLACLNTKDDTYMITSDGKYLVFLTFDYIIKYDIQNQEIVTKHTLAPLLFPFLKKMLVRRRDLLLNHDGNKILGIIEEKIGIESNYCFMIYNIQENTTKILDLKLENGEKVKEWIVADNWVNEIFYKVEKETKLRQIPPYETKKRKIEIIKKYDLRRGKSETFYVCHSVNGMFHKFNDDEDLVKHDVDIKHVPFFQLGWILIYEGVTRDPSIFNMKILDIHNKKILAPIIDKNFTKEFLASTSKMNFGYLHFIGNLGMEKLFLRSDFNIYALEPRLRLLHTINNLNLDLKKKSQK